MIKVENNIVSVNGLSIQFDSNERANSFLLDYISKHGQEEKQDFSVDKNIVIERLGYFEGYELKKLIDEYGAIEIENLDLSVRGYNILKRANINTIEDILLLDYNDVVRIRNMGRKSLLEIQDKVNRFIRKDFIKWAEQVPYSQYEDVSASCVL